MLIAFLYKYYGISNFISLGFCNVILGIFLSQKLRNSKKRTNSKKGHPNTVNIRVGLLSSFGLLICL